LQGLGKLAIEKGARIQSHMAEAQEEVQWVLDERQKLDIDIFEQASNLSVLTDVELMTFELLVQAAYEIRSCPLHIPRYRHAGSDG